MKGFYGKPVCYEVMCDKFDTKFNSSTGDFDITARFIGYNYSFLTDVSMDALIAAPYSDYLGSKYWQDEIASGRFTLKGKDGVSEVPIPTMIEIRNKVAIILKDAPPSESPMDAEEKYHTDEIEELNSLKMLFQSWYSALYKALSEKYTKDFCYLFKTKGNQDVFYRILILTTHTLTKDSNLSYIYEDLGSDFKKLNDDLYAAIEKYNSDTEKQRTKLTNVSKDFSDYIAQPLFNKTFLDDKGNVIFNGFDKNCKLGHTDVVNKVFYGIDYKDDENMVEKRKQHKDYILSKIYNDGIMQYVNCYCIEVPYDSLQNRIKGLQNEVNQDPQAKENKAKLRALNNALIEKMGWYPTVENFTKIMMAHMETLMHIMYKTVDAAHGRKVSELNVTVGNNGSCMDVNSNSDTVPPFPRVTKEVIGDDGIVKKEDDWVGNVSSSFVEVDMVNGLFNGIDKANSLIQAANVVVENKQDEIDNPTEESSSVIKHPLTPFDLFIKKSPYGDNDEIMNDASGDKFIGRVAMRMFALLNLNRLAWINKRLTSDENIKKIAIVEVENFNKFNKAVNEKFVELIIGGTLTGDKFIEKITKANKSNPWGGRALIGADNELSAYITKGGKPVYPIQNSSYSSIQESVNKLNSNNYIFSDSYTENPPVGTTYKVYSKATYGLGGCAILDNFQGVTNTMNNANSSTTEDYQVIYNELSGRGFGDTLSNQQELSNLSWKANGTLVKIYGISPDGSFDGSTTYGASYNRHKFQPIVLDTMALSPQQQLIARALIGIVLGDFQENLDSMKTNVFIHMHRLQALKIGAMVCASGTIFWDNSHNYYRIISSRLQIKGGYNEPNINGRIKSFLPKIRAEFAKYFINWSNSAIAKKLLDIATNNKYYDKNYELKESDQTVIEVSKNLLGEVVVVSLTRGSIDKKNHVTKNQYKTYFNAFINKLKEIYTGKKQNEQQQEDTTPKENSIGGMISSTTSSPNKCTEDMKKGLYAYLKLVYDKWIPSSSFDKWKIENYFEEYNTDENIGDKFYFIDSYYNKIGQKLLINPQKLYEKIDALMSYQDVNVMMLGFMADIYSQNKCMLMAIQNFADISKKDSMNELFKPLPYNSIDWSTVNRHPSFVVVYPYEPSKHLNVANSEYNDDSFMLNDENETPIAIRSRNGDGTYCIPAFGVTYGRQYQSYFKNVDIGTQTPVATQQSIKAKHYILKDANGAKNNVGAVAQDLYDIYSTQSYTCNVTMMGCAWIQPMMYFVLLNVPMFRGSYLIMKVKHSLRPGDMVTTFTGCRMASVSNPLVEDIFTDDSYGGGSNGVSTQEQFADVDNNCPYKVYPLFQSSFGDFEYTYPRDKSKESFAKTMFCAYKKYDESLNDVLVMALVGQDCQESTWGTSAASSQFNFGGVKSYGSQRGQQKYQRYNSIDDYIRGKITSCLDKNFKGWEKATSVSEYVNEIQVKHLPLYYAGDKNYLGNLQNMYYSVKKRIGSFVTGANTSAAKKKKDEKLTNEDVANALFEALQKSVSSTPSASVTLKKYYNKNKNILMISQENKSGDHLGNVFDILLNGYYDYIKELYWVYDSKNGNTKDPLHIDVIPSLSPNAAQRKVFVCESNNVENSKSREVGSDANKKLRLALYKKYGGVNKEVPQVKNKDTYKDLTVTDCGEIMKASTIGSTASGSGNISQKKIELFGETWTGKKPKAWCESFLKNVTISYRSQSNGELKQHTVLFHRKLEGNLQGLFNELAKHPEFYVHSFGTYSYRNVVGSSTPKLSNHSYGIAFDLNPHYNPYIKNGVVKGGANIYNSILSMRDKSNWIVQTCAKYGFGWGGWYKDYMHFSYFDGR